MEKEKQVQNTEATAVNAAQAQSDDQKFKVEVQDGIVLIPDLRIERSPYKSKGQEYFEYKLVGKFNGKDMSILLEAKKVSRGNGDNRFTAGDRETYDQLNSIFDLYDSDKIRFGIRIGKDQNKRKTITYYVGGLNARGRYLPAEVAINSPSGKTTLHWLLCELEDTYDIKLPSVL